MTAHLQAVASHRSIVLNEPLYWRLDYRPADLGVLPGVYHATRENALGTFFEGPEGAYFLLAHDDTEGLSIERTDGGLWIPKDGGPARIWAWFDANHKRTKQRLGRPVTPKEIVPEMSGTVVGAPSGRDISDAATEITIQKIALGQMPGGVAGGAVAGAMGGAISGALWSSYVGMRDVVIFTPPVEESARRPFEKLTQTVTSLPSRP